MEETIANIRNQFSRDLSVVTTLADIEPLKIKYLGKKGSVQGLMIKLKDASAGDRPALGKIVNDLKSDLSAELEKTHADFIASDQQRRLKTEKIDETLPGRRHFAGRKHVVTQALDEIIDILADMGFSVQYGPDIDTDYYNFEALNFPNDHPARDMQDTFYISPHVLLRTHTSNIQARILETQKPPIRIIAPGRAYRNETITARSHVFFHQVEGFYVDKGVTFKDLLSTMTEFFRKLFKKEISTRFRPSYFPFVEPGLEIDISCLLCEGQGCALCKHSGWLEVCGAGMIHPEVLKLGDLDPEIYSGYAWGMGVERILLIKNGIKDIRLFTQNDVRFLSQFSGT